MMNIDAKPWYPTDTPIVFTQTEGLPPYTAMTGVSERAAVGDVEEVTTPPCTSTPDSSTCTRRHDPYRSAPFTPQETQSHPYASDPSHYSPSHAKGVTTTVDYSDQLYGLMRSQDLIDGPPTYQEFVLRPQQPYRSAQFRTQHDEAHGAYYQRSDPSATIELEHHGVSASGSHSTGSNESASETPRAASDKKPQKVAVAVSIPLPRSRRSLDVLCAADIAATTPHSSAHASPVRPNEGSDFPLPAPRSRAALVAAENKLANAQHASHGEPDDVETSMIAKLEAMLSRSRDPQQLPRQQPQQQAQDAARTEGVVPHPAAPKVQSKAVAGSRNESPTHSLEHVDTKESVHKKKQQKKKDEWKIVDGPTASCKANGVGSLAKRNQAASASHQATTVVSNKFELGHPKGSKKMHANTAEASASDDDDVQPIICATSTAAHDKKRSKQTKQSASNEDQWLDAVAKAGEAALELHHQHILHNTHGKDALVFMGFLTLNALPNVSALLPKKPTQQLSVLASSLFKIISEPSAEVTQRHNALRRLMEKVMQPQVMGQTVALAIVALVEACDACMEFDMGIDHVRQAIQLARAHHLQSLELLALMQYCRYSQRLLDGADCTSELHGSLKLAFHLGEERAAGWISHMLAIQLEVSGAFFESLCWNSLATRIGQTQNDHRLAGEAVTYIAIATAALGAMPEATELMAIAEEKRTHLTRSGAQRIVQNLAQVCIQIGDLDLALRYHTEERDAAKAANDLLQAAQLTYSIATVKRSMGQVEQALHDHQEEMAMLSQCPSSRQTECLLGTALCLKQLGLMHKSRDCMMKVLRSARENGDQSIIAKALAEIADCDDKDGNFDDAMSRLVEGLRIIDQASPNDCKQFYLKVNICEAEWKIVDVLEGIHFRHGKFVDAVRYGDAMRLPNTADVVGILQKRQRKAMPTWSAAQNNNNSTATTVTTAAAKKSSGPVSRTAMMHHAAEQFLKQRFFDTNALAMMLADKKHGRVDYMVVYSLRWDENLEFTAYVLEAGPPEDGGAPTIASDGRKLRMSPAAVQVLIGTHSALFRAFHNQTTDPSGNELYCDTPLFPQHHWYTQKCFMDEHPEESRRIHEDLDYCLELMYDALIRPLEPLLHMDASAAAPTVPSRSLPKVLFVGDGAISMIPFQALRCSQTATTVMDHCVSTKLPSVQHALTLYAKRLSMQKATSSDAPSDVVAPRQVSLVTAFSASEQRVKVLLEATAASTIVEISSGDDVAAVTRVPSRKTIMEDESLEVKALAGMLVEATMSPKPRDKRLSNELFRALFVDCPRRAPLLLDLPVIPDVKEDFSGLLSTQWGSTLVTSSEVAITWDLSSFPVVVTTRFGAYGGRGIHETGVPVHRAMLLAGAQRLLLPVGSSLDNVDEMSLAVVNAAVNAEDDQIVEAIHDAMHRLRAAGCPVQTWSAFTLFGLP